MRTDAAFTAALLCLLVTPVALAQETGVSEVTETAPPSLADRFSLGAGAEVDLVGLAYGVRPEVLFRPFEDDGGPHLRLAVGLMAGPELTFLPVAVGYRHIFSEGRRVRAHLGLGYEQQTFWYGGDSPVSRPAFYAETGWEILVGRKAWLGLQFAPDLAPFSLFGFGFATRVTFRYDL